MAVILPTLVAEARLRVTTFEMLVLLRGYRRVCLCTYRIARVFQELDMAYRLQNLRGSTLSLSALLKYKMLGLGNSQVWPPHICNS
jgi:hypothetical protein